MATHNPIPIFYRVVFTFIDPGFCLMGFALHLFDTRSTLLGYSPNAVHPPAVETVHLLDSMAGFFLALGLLEGFLLRVKATDAAVWRVVQASISVLDIIMVFGAVRAMTAEGRMDLTYWRGDDWRLVVGNAVRGVARLACAFGLGFGIQEKSKGS